jgi:hypothetical protein
MCGGTSAYITKKWTYLLLLAVCPIYIVFAYFGDPGRGMAAAIGAAVITLTVRYFWDLRSFGWFWTIVAFLVILHLPLIAFIPWPNNNYTYIQRLPFAALDFGISYGIIRLVSTAKMHKK